MVFVFRQREQENPLAAGINPDRVIVVKHGRTLSVMSRDKIIETYTVLLGRAPVGPKTLQGDHKTPEGQYVLDRRNASSRFYSFIDISYPDPNELKWAPHSGLNSG